MTGIRLTITVFLLALMSAAAMGWMWAGANQPPAGAMASRVVLTISALAGVVALVAIWRWRPPASRPLR